SLGVLASVFGAGIYGVLNAGQLPTVQTAGLTNPALTQVSALADPNRQRNNIDYSRPEADDQFAFNAGGPFDADDLTSNNEELEKALRSIEATTNPSYLPSIWPHASKINNEYGFR